MKIIAGLPAKYNFTLPNHSASNGWTLAGQLTDTDGTYALATDLFTGDGSTWTLAIPSATTASYAAGDCMLYVVATLDTTEETVLSEASTIEALGTVSHNRKMVTALNALMEGRSTQAYETLTTPDGESISRLDPEKLQQWLLFYEKRLATEHAARAAGSIIKTHQIGF